MPSRIEKYDSLRARLGSYPGALVAFSAGVDSTMLLAACVEVLGASRVRAVTAVSASYPGAENAEGEEIAALLGVERVLLDTHEMDVEGYRKNGMDRCYYCKSELFDRMKKAVEVSELPDWPILYGAILDDLSDYRPGAKAASEAGVLAPLQEEGWSKEEVREWSRERKLPTADKGSFACLSSRIPTGTAIDRALLLRVERAEEWFRRRGFRQFRVRHHGEVARIEVLPDEIPRLLGKEGKGLVTALQALGWKRVCVDLEGFRSS